MRLPPLSSIFCLLASSSSCLLVAHFRILHEGAGVASERLCKSYLPEPTRRHFGGCAHRLSITIIPLQSCFELAAPEDFADRLLVQSSGPNNVAVVGLLEAPLIAHDVVSQIDIFSVLPVARYARFRCTCTVSSAGRLYPR